jgi:hypothetical protein
MRSNKQPKVLVRSYPCRQALRGHTYLDLGAAAAISDSRSSIASEEGFDLLRIADT